MFNKLVKAKNSKKGFTLIEVMVVVAIIAILAAVAIPAYLSYKDNAKAEVAKTSFSSVMESYNGYITVNNGAGYTGIADATVGEVAGFLLKNGANITTDHLDLDAPFANGATLVNGYYILKADVTAKDGQDNVEYDCWLDFYAETAETPTALA